MSTAKDEGTKPKWKLCLGCDRAYRTGEKHMHPCVRCRKTITEAGKNQDGTVHVCQ